MCGWDDIASIKFIPLISNAVKLCVPVPFLNCPMVSLRSLPRTFRSIEWIFLTAHLGIWLSNSGYNLLVALGLWGILFLLSWWYPLHRPQWQRWLYIAIALVAILGARLLGIDLGLFMQIYFAKSYVLIGRRTAIAFMSITALPWTASEYFAELDRFRQQIPLDPLGLDPSNPLRFMILTLAIYVAAGCFTIMFTEMLVTEQKNHHQIAQLSEQVESLAATLERTRIAREIHDSLGHTLTDLDTQLAVAQTLRSHNPTAAFQAVDLAKLLARQCIEDVSQALEQMRQSDFDLNQALVALLAQLHQTATLQVQWTVNLPQLPIYQSYQIYCIVKEGVMNVQKHAQASQVHFSAHKTPQGIVLDLKDNGVGFDQQAFKPGFGLQGMIERVQLLGGQFDLQTAVTQGTKIHIMLPL
jgi:signal transduction histidine kinase